MQALSKRNERRHRTRGTFAGLSALAALSAMVWIAPTARAASTIMVPRDFPTIQAAVNAAASGDTVIVQSGTYTEQVVVSGKNVNLRGAGAATTTIKSPATLAPFGMVSFNNRPVAAIVRIAHGAHVRMSGFTVTGPIPCGPGVNGIAAMQASTLDLTASQIVDIHPAPSCPSDQATGRGVSFGAPSFVLVEGAAGSTASGRVANVTIARYNDLGIGMFSPPGVTPTQVAVANNVITGGSQIPTEQFGIAIGRATVTVTGNTISDAVCTIPGCGPDPINEFQSGGIIAGPAPGTRISGNHISGTDIGVYQIFAPHCCQISDNTLENNRFFGIVIQDGDGETRGNVISGGQVGIGVVADAVDTTGILRGDQITGTSIAPVRELQCCGFTATAVIKPA